MNKLKEFAISVLGSRWIVRLTQPGEDSYFERNKAEGYCDAIIRVICLLDLKNTDSWKNEKSSADQEVYQLLRHEIIHAYLFESGLWQNCLQYEGGWAQNEEMVDWFARQWPKIDHTIRFASQLLGDAL